MKMSTACTAPVQPANSAADCAHSRYREYRQYRDAMCRQLVTGLSFQSWLAATEERENGHEVVYEVTSKTAQLKPGWYKNVFEPGERSPMTFGPFPSEIDAQNFSGY